MKLIRTTCFGWYLFLLIYTHIYESRVDAVFCNPQNWEYYRWQVKDCGHCEPCVKGEEKMTMEEYDVKMGKNGARRCLPCRTCRKGTYSDKHTHKCSICTNCTAQELTVIRPCTHLQDAECGPPSQPKNDVPNTTVKNEYKYASVTEDKFKTFPLRVGFVVLCTICVFILIYCLIQWRKRKRKDRQTAFHPTSQETSVQEEQSDEMQRFVTRDDDIDLKMGTQEDDVLIDIDETCVKSYMNESVHPLSEVIYRRTRLEDVEEEPLHDLVDCECIVQVQSNHRETDKGTTVDEKTNLIPKEKRQRKRHASCSLDHYSSDNYGAISDTFVDGDGKQATTDAVAINRTGNGRSQSTKHSLQRQVSVPVTCQEHKNAPEMTLDKPDEPPSVEFKTYFSKVSAVDKLYKNIALEVGLDENTVNIIEEDFKDKGCHEVAYLVTKKMGENLVSKRSIYNSLGKKNPKEVHKLKIREIKAINKRSMLNM